MPRLPSVTVGGGSDARRVINPVVDQPIDQTFAGLAAISEDLANRAIEDENHKDRLRSIELQEQYARETEEATAELDPIGPDYIESVETGNRDRLNEIMGNTGIRNDEIRKELELRLTAKFEGELSIAAATRRQKIEDHAVNLYAQASDRTLAQIRGAPDDADAFLAQFQDTVGQMGESISAERKRALAEVFGDDVIAAQVEGLAEAGRGREARELVKEMAGELDPNVATNLGRRIREIENIGQSEAMARVSGELTDIQVGALDATTDAQITTLRARLEKLDAEGRLPGPLQSAKVALLRSLEARRSAIMKEGETLRDGLVAYNNGTLTKPAQVDAVYAEHQRFLPRDENGQIATETALGHLGMFVGNTGRMPSEAKAFIENGEHGNDASQLAAATTMHRRIREFSSNVPTGAGDRIALTEAWMDLGGMSAEDAAQRVIAQTPDRATAKQRDDEFADIAADFNSTTFFTEDVLDRGLFTRLFTDEPAVPAAAQRDAERTYAFMYRQMGDKAVALEATKNAMQRKYGVTRTGGGGPRVTKFPAETFFINGPQAKYLHAKTDLLNDVIEEDISTALTDLGLQIPDAPVGLEDIPAYSLVPDRETERGIAAGEPSWELRVRDEFGNMVPVRVDTPSGPVNVRINAMTQEDLEGSQVYQAAIQEQNDAIEIMKERQEDMERRAITRPEINDPAGPATEPDELTGMSARESTPTDIKGKPRGIRNNNPMNIEMRDGVTWQGQVRGDDKRFATFQSPEMGIRAAARVLRNYQRLHGLNTVGDMIARWAPKQENATAQYARFVADRMGVTVDRNVDLSDGVLLDRMLKAMIRFENGVQPYSDSIIQRGIELEAK